MSKSNRAAVTSLHSGKSPQVKTLQKDMKKMMKASTFHQR